MNKNKAIIKKMVYNNLNGIYRASMTIAKSHIYELIPLVVLKEVIEKSKPTQVEEMPVEFIKVYNTMLDELYKVCELDATKSNLVFPIILRHHIAVAKSSFLSGLG